VRVADRDRKKFEELFAGGWAGARDDGCGVAKESGETTASVAMPFISGMPGFCLSMRFH